MWQCLNPDCKKIFQVLGRVSKRKRPPQDVGYDVTEIITDSPCCPFCQSLEFEEVLDDPKPTKARKETEEKE